MAVLLGAISSKTRRVIVAIDKKNQRNIDMAIYWGFKYDSTNSEYSKEKYLRYLKMLPKSEQNRVKEFVF
jgi:hypothetical protein